MRSKSPLFLTLLFSLWVALAVPSLSAQNVLTWHNDNARTGQNLTEKILTLQNVNAKTFGKLFVIPVDGKVDAEPLYAERLDVANAGKRNVLFVATEHDSVYAFEADTGKQLWRVSLLKAGETPSDNLTCSQIIPEIGITSTPVIDLHAGPHGTIYVVAMSKHQRVYDRDYVQRLHALDLQTGAEEFEGPVEVQARFPGRGAASRNGVEIFDPKQYAERAALLLLNGVIYTSWTSHCDIDPYNGWIIAYSAQTLQQTAVVNFTPNGDEGSVWQSGSGAAADTEGNIYVMAANGTFDPTLDPKGFPSRGDFGNSFLKLSTPNEKLGIADYFTMFNVVDENANDSDLGAGGPVVLPDMKDASGKTWHLVVGAGKDRNIYLLNRDAMGKFNPKGNQNIYQELPEASKGRRFRGSPAYFDGRLYFGSVDDVIREFKFANARLIETPASETAMSYVYPGAMPSVSANGTQDGIVWAVENKSEAVLHAYDAHDLTHELYNSKQASSGRDDFGAGNKFIVPLIVHGKVYVGTANGVGVFGLLSNSGASQPAKSGK
jgi:outer membrane protein assembly factor BamB